MRTRWRFYLELIYNPDVHPDSTPCRAHTPELPAVPTCARTLLTSGHSNTPSRKHTAMGLIVARYGQMRLVEMDQAVMCTTLALMRPSPAVVHQIEELLEAAADERGLGLLIGVVAPTSTPPTARAAAQGKNEIVGLHSSLECAWRMSTSAAKRGGHGRASVWMVQSQADSSTEWAVAGAAQAEAFASAARLSGPDARVTVLSLANVTPPVGVDAATFREWTGYFFLHEVHACTDSRAALGVMGCHASVRRYRTSCGSQIDSASC
jgi:hypothetical protein